MGGPPTRRLAARRRPRVRPRDPERRGLRAAARPPSPRQRLADARVSHATGPARRARRLVGVRRRRQRPRHRGVLPARAVPARAPPLVVRRRRRHIHGRVRGALPRRSAAAALAGDPGGRDVLPRAARRRQLLAARAHRQPGGARQRRPAVLRRLPPAGRSLSRGVALAVALALGGITLAIALSDAGAASLWRHVYHVPVAAAALRWGGAGFVAALGAVLLYAPFVLPALERSGPTPAVLEGLLTFAVLLGVGGLSAALAAGARRQRARY